MIISIQTDNQTYKIDAEKPLDISIPLNFGGAQPNAYGVEIASSKPCEAENLIGDVRRGGSCNFEQVKFIPHCNGTHTESVGHITRERISIRDCLSDAFSPAYLISVESEYASRTDETYPVKLADGDKLITRRAIEKSVKSSALLSAGLDSLIIRTLPNDDGKLSRTYLKEIPPFFSTEAMEFMNEMCIVHLLTDLPSIDRIFDEGKLSNHRNFWKIEQGSFEINPATLVHHTITELIYIPNEIKDGMYLLNLQIAPFMADAAPSRPVIFKIAE